MVYFIYLGCYRLLLYTRGVRTGAPKISRGPLYRYHFIVTSPNHGRHIYNIYNIYTPSCRRRLQ